MAEMQDYSIVFWMSLLCDAEEWKEDRYRIIWFPARGKILGSMHKSSDYALFEMKEICEGPVQVKQNSDYGQKYTFKPKSKIVDWKFWPK